MKSKRVVNGICCVLMLWCSSAFADSWQIETVDSSGNVGGGISLADMSITGEPNISYYSTNGKLMYACNKGSGWSISTVDSPGDEGATTSIMLDVAADPRNPCISYTDGSHLKFAALAGSHWTITSLDPGHDSDYPSIACDSNGNPYIPYYDSDYGNLRYCYWTGYSWNIETIDPTSGVGMFTSIALDSNDNAHISYYDFLNYHLKYVYWTGSSWSIQTVDSSTENGQYTSIAVQSAGNIHISYYDQDGDALKYAHYYSGSWHIQYANEEPGGGGLFTSIDVDSSGYPHISYFDENDADLMYVHWTGSTWSIETIDSLGVVGMFTSLSLDKNNNPCIAYLDGSKQNLKYAFYNQAPSNFRLLSPVQDSYADNPPTLDWEDADDVQDLTYDLWYSTEADFNPHTEITDLTDSTYTFPPGVLSSGQTYYWKVTASDGYEESWCTAPGGGGQDEYWTFHINNTNPASFAILNLYPNPVAETMTCLLSVPEPGRVKLALYDLSGRMVYEESVLVSEPNEVSVQLDVASLASGTYTLQATCGGVEASARCVVTR